MKQTNNAIKFLMAQYRAIYESAYFKGLATAGAAALTLGLAAGQAQAADLTNTEFDKIEANSIIDIPTKFDKINISTAATNANKFTINLSTDKNAINTVEGVAVTANKATVFLKGDNTKLNIAASTSNAAAGSLTVDNLNLEKGSVEVAANAQAATLDANRISLASGTSISVLSTGAGAATLGGNKTSLFLGEGSTVTLGKSGSMTGAKLSANKGTIKFVDGTLSAPTYYDGDKGGKPQVLNLTVAATKTGNIALKNDGDKLGVLHLDSGSVIDLVGGATASNLNIKANADSKGSILILNEGAVLKSSKDGSASAGGVINVSGAAASNSELHVAGKVLGGFLAPEDQTKNLAGSVLLQGNSTLKFIGKTSVDIAADTTKADGSAIVVVSGANTTTGKVTLSAESTISGENLTISKAFGDANNLQNVLNVQADNLTLGNSSAHHSGDALGAKSISAKNIKFVDKDTFVLKDTITLQNIKADPSDSTKNIAQDGKIEGPVILADATKPLTVDGGKFTSTGDITISGGKLLVQNTNKADVSSVTASGGNYILDRAAQNGAITVSGANTLLDLSNATLKYKDDNVATNNVTLTVQDGGEIKVKGDDLGKLLVKGKSGAVFDIQAQSKLSVTGNLTLSDPTLIVKTATAANQTSEIVLSGSGTLAVADTLELQKFDATNGLTINTNATLQAGTLKLMLEETAASGNAAILKDGHFVITNGLETNAEKGLVVSGANSTFDLGGIETKDKVSTSLSNGGKVSVDVTISGGKATVTSGKWVLDKNLTLESAGSTLTVGHADTVVDAKGEGIGAALAASNLIIKTGGSATVNTTGSLDVTNIDAISNSITVSGAMIIAGTYNEKETSSDAFKKFGIKLADDAITLKAGGSLTLNGAGVEKALGAVGENGGKITNFQVDSGAFATAGALKSEAGSTLTINYFKKGTVLTKEALTALSKGLFGDPTTELKGSIDLGNVVFDGLASSGGEVKWSVAKEYGTNFLPKYKNKDLMAAVLVQDTTDSSLYGHWGAVKDNDAASGTSITFAENASLNKATHVNGKKYFAVGKDGALLGLDVAQNGTLTLANGGMADAITIGNSGSFIIDSRKGNTTELTSVSGGDTAQVTLSSGKAVVNKDLKTGYMKTAEGSDLHVKGDLTLSSDNANDKTPSVFEGTVTVDKNVSLSGDTTFAAKTQVSGDFTSANEVTFAADTTIKGTAQFEGDKTLVLKGGLLNAKRVELATKDDSLFIGNQTKEGEGDKAKYNNEFGFLDAETAQLKSGSVFLTGKSVGYSSIGAIDYFGAAPQDINKITNAGTVDGKVVVGSNSALMVGPQASIDEMQYLYYRTGGAVMYLKDKLTVADGARIILDAEAKQEAVIKDLGKTNDGKYAAKWNGGASTPPKKTDADLFLGAGATLFVGPGVVEEDSAVYFDKEEASILAEKGSKVVLDGDRFISSRDITIFKDKDQNNGGKVQILGNKGENDIVVESINGIMGFTMEAGDYTQGGNLELLKDKVDSAYRGASSPMRDYLISYASLTKNWQAYYSKDPDANNGSSVDSNIDRDYLVSHKANDNEATVDQNGVITAKQGFHASQFVTVKDSKGEYQVYHKAFNEFLEKVVRNTNGLAADQAARMGVFGGAADAAMLVGKSTSEAISGRFGMGHQGQIMTYANNGQGGAMWAVPVYKSREASSLEAQGLEFGTDTSIRGLVLGGDLTFDDGMRYGVSLNLGEGDSSGDGAANGVSGEFKYYGLGLYAGFNYQAFSVVADLGFAVVDSDVEANTAAGNVSSSFDATNISAGVTGQVNLSYRDIDIVPHIGARFSRIKLDDYDINGFGHVASTEANVYSVPAGVTISKEYFSEEWSFKPSIDFNVTGHFGDDSLDSTVGWNGINNLNVDTKTQFTDTGVSYGVLVGFGAESERLSIGAGLGYSGSSNIDEFTLTGSARYTF